MNANDLVRQILRFKSAWPRRCHWSDEEIGEQAAAAAKKIGWLTPENLGALFTEMISRGNLNLEKMVKRAREIQPYTGPEGAASKAEREMSPEGRRVSRIMSHAVAVWCRRIWDKQEPLANLEREIRDLFTAEKMPQRCWDTVERWFAEARAQKSPVEAPEAERPVQSTGEPVEAPPGEAQAALTTNSGVQVGDGTGADEDIPF